MKKRTIIALGVFIISATAAAWWLFFRKSEPIISLETEQAQYGYIARDITATGTIEPVDTVTVGSQVSGTIQHIYVDFNAVVKKGQLIAQLDKSLMKAAVDQYAANLQMANAQLEYQTSLFNRQTTLFHTGSISRQDYETALYQYHSAQADVLSVRAQLEAARKNLSYCDIFSPVDGVVLLRNVSMGQTVAASFSTPVLFIIARDITKMQVQAAVDEADIGDVRLGQHVTFTVDAFPDDVFSGKVGQVRLQPTISANVVTYTTIINSPNDSLKLKPGMTANIFVYTREEPHALLISARALKYKPAGPLPQPYLLQTAGLSGTPAAGEAWIWVKSGDSVLRRTIRTGLTDDTHVQVLSGLTPADEVVLGITAPQKKAGTAAAVTASPFMPTRRAAPTVVRPQSGQPAR
jgi:HlyD family secretion protein